MVSDEAGERQVLFVGRTKYILYCALQLVVAAAGIWVALEVSPLGWGLTALASAIAVYVASAVLGGRWRLELDPDGFTTRSLLGRRRYSWAQIVEFIPTRIGGHEAVAFRVVEGAPVQPFVGPTRAARGFDGWLPDTYGMRAAALAALLEARRAGAARDASA